MAYRIIVDEKSEHLKKYYKTHGEKQVVRDMIAREYPGTYETSALAYSAIQDKARILKLCLDVIEV